MTWVKSGEPASAVDDVAAAILRLTGPLAPTKLQKLLYYSQAWHLAFHEVPLFGDRIEAWQRGPVVPAVWQARRYADWITDWGEGDPDRLPAAARETVGWVVSHYGSLSASDLSRLSHLERPWLEAWGDRPPMSRGTTPISQETMMRYYRAMVAHAGRGEHTLASLDFEGLVVAPPVAAKIRAVAAGEADVAAIIRRRVAELTRD